LIPEFVFGIPAHPLIIHAVVVLLPLSAIGMIAMVLIPPFRGKVQKYFVAGTLIIATGNAFLAMQSGQTLNMTKSVSEYHQEWGTRTFYAALGLTALSALWLWLDTKPKSIFKTITGILVVIVSLAAITAAVLAGHSGAESVWLEDTNMAVPNAVIPPISDVPPVTTESTISLSEVALHASADDCWSVVNGNVYELTQWISGHPGGSSAIESMCGIDASTMFNNQHNGQGEPETSLASFQIGRVG
jgi:cytochrome b involved in lipid metabolism